MVLSPLGSWLLEECFVRSPSFEFWLQMLLWPRILHCIYNPLDRRYQYNLWRRIHVTATLSSSTITWRKSSSSAQRLLSRFQKISRTSLENLFRASWLLTDCHWLKEKSAGPSILIVNWLVAAYTCSVWSLPPFSQLDWHTNASCCLFIDCFHLLSHNNQPWQVLLAP